jgi:fructose-1,6-bisphosphatase/inositol monophosphatase family enzyme
VHNNGGHLFALRVAEGTSPDSYGAALEHHPVGLWEHIGPLLSERAGAVVSRLDGMPLVIDPRVKQTSITAANPRLAEEIIEVLNPSRRRLPTF